MVVMDTLPESFVIVWARFGFEISPRTIYVPECFIINTRAPLGNGLLTINILNDLVMYES